jgi:threonine dehydrogenase-like Zn-dependent dehydrogenase
MAAGEVNTQDVITYRIKLKDLHHGLDLMKNRQCLKVLVYPNGVEDEA